MVAALPCRPRVVRLPVDRLGLRRGWGSPERSTRGRGRAGGSRGGTPEGDRGGRSAALRPAGGRRHRVRRTRPRRSAGRPPAGASRRPGRCCRRDAGRLQRAPTGKLGPDTVSALRATGVRIFRHSCPLCAPLASGFRAILQPPISQSYSPPSPPSSDPNSVIIHQSSTINHHPQ